MKTLLTLVTGLALGVANIAWSATERRDLEAFTDVSFSLPYEVVFVIAAEPYITFEGDADTIDEIQTRVKNGTLKVYKENSWFDWSDKEVVVTIGFTRLDSLTMAGSGDGYAELLETDELTLRITGSANLEVRQANADEIHISIAGSGNLEIHAIEADEVTSTIAGSGNVELAGRCVVQEISISGSGNLDARELNTQETSASIRGSGDARVWAEARLSASLVGSGNLRYYGNPTVNERIVGSGSLTHLSPTP